MYSRYSSNFSQDFIRKLSSFILVIILITPFTWVLGEIEPTQASYTQVADLTQEITPPEERQAAPWQAIEQPSLTLNITVEPSVLTIGDKARLVITLENQSEAAAHDVTIQLPLPDGVKVFSGEKNYSESKAAWIWQLDQLKGLGRIQLEAEFQVEEVPVGEAILTKPLVTTRELPEPLAYEGGAIVIGESNQFTTDNYNPTGSTKLISSTGNLAVDMEADSYFEPLTLSYKQFKAGADLQKSGSIPTRLPSNVIGSKHGLGIYSLEAYNPQGEAVHKFKKPLSISIKYTPEQLRALHLNETNLSLYWYDESSGEWVPQDSQVDPNNHLVKGKVDHFSLFSLGDGSSPSEAYLPSLKGFQTDLFTGSVNYSVEVELPAGPANLKPGVSLGYNSGSVDGNVGGRQLQQSNWVGKGWNLNAGGFVAAKKIVISAGTGKVVNYYTVSFGGRTFDMVRGNQIAGDSNNPYKNDYLDWWEWKPVEENFARIQAVFIGNSTLATKPYATIGDGQNDATIGRGGFYDDFSTGLIAQPRYKWVVTTTDGMRYEFSSDMWWGWETCGASSNRSASMEPYKWNLTSVSDTFNNVIRYNYQYQSFVGGYVGGTGCAWNAIRGTIDRDAWLTSITWANNRYRVIFDSAARTSDTSYDTPDGQYAQSSGAVRETRILNRILVQSSLDSANWNLLREYRLFDASISGYDRNVRDHNLYSDRWMPGPETPYPKLALNGLTLIGNNGSNMLPPTKFTYLTAAPTGNLAPGGWQRLGTIDNSQGGKVTVAYDNIQAVSGTWIFHNRNRVTRKTLEDGRGNSYTWSYTYDKPAMNSIGKLLGDKDSLHDTPNSAILYYNKYMDSLHNNESKLAEQKFDEFRGHAYVKEVDPNGNYSEHWFYQGDVPCGYPGISSGDPLGTANLLQKDSCFRQMRDREFLKGKEYRTDIKTGAGTLISRQYHCYWVFFDSDNSMGTSLLGGTQHCGVDTANIPFIKNTARYTGNYGSSDISGLWPAFYYKLQDRTDTFEGNGTPSIRATNYYYEPTEPDNTSKVYQAGGKQYGNMTRKEDYYWNGTSWSLYRGTISWYATLDNASSYLVNRVGATADFDSNRNYLSTTNNFYDNNNTINWNASNALGGKGALTREIKYRNVPSIPAFTTTQCGSDGGTLKGTDATYTFSANGNRLTETTYAGEGSYNCTNWTVSAPGNGSAARTTTYTYDSYFNAMPTSSVNALGHKTVASYDYAHGLLTKVTDPNGKVTEAGYDAFGRLTQLIRPGNSDSTASASSNTYYYDNETPVRYMVQTKVANSNQGDNLSQINYFYDGMGRQIQTKSESQEFGKQTIVTDKRYDGLGQVIQTSQPRYLADTWNVYTNPGSGDLYRATKTSYDVAGRPAKLTYPDNSTASYRYFVSNTLGGSRYLSGKDFYDQNNHLTRWYSDEFGRNFKVEEYAGNNGSEGSYSLYATTKYDYTPQDLLYRVTDARNDVTTLSYDTLGHKTSLSAPDLGNWQYSYDANGNLTSQIDAKNQRVNFQYDSLNRLVKKSYPDGTYNAYGYDETTYSTNSIGRLSSVQAFNSANAGQSWTRWQFDDRGRKVQSAQWVSGLSAARTFRWAYDSSDRITSMTYPHGEVLSYTYDAASREVSMCSSFGPCYVQNAQYSAISQSTQYTLNNGVVERRSYSSPLERLTQIRISNSGGADLFNVSYNNYDSGGNITRVTDNLTGETQSYTYDHRDRLTSSYYQTNRVRIRAKGQMGSEIMQLRINGTVISQWTLTTSWADYSAVLATPVASNDKIEVVFTNDASDPANGIDRNVYVDYIVVGDQTIQAESPSVLYPAGTKVYDSQSVVMATNGAMGFYTGKEVTVRAHGQTGREIMQLKVNNTLISQQTVGTSWADYRIVLTNPLTPTDRLDIAFANDASDSVGDNNLFIDYFTTGGRQLQADSPLVNYDTQTTQGMMSGQDGLFWNGSLTTRLKPSYSYDATGNLTTKGDLAYSYSGAHLATTIGRKTVGYDANGNTTTGYGYTLGWNYDNKPVSITNTTTSTAASFQYDVNGDQVAYSQGSTKVVYLEGMMWEETIGSTQHPYYYFNEHPIAFREGTTSTSQVKYLHSDHQSSIRFTTDSAGGILGSRESYDPWGKVRSGTNAQTPFKFTGQLNDAGLGIYYYKARFYDPTTGRFMSPDTMISGSGAFQGPTNPQQLNRYSYVGNNPVNRLDPSGNDWEAFTQYCAGVVEGMGAAGAQVAGLFKAETWQSAGRGVQALVTQPSASAQVLVDEARHQVNTIAAGAQLLANDPGQAAQILADNPRGVGQVLGGALAQAATGPRQNAAEAASASSGGSFRANIKILTNEEGAGTAVSFGKGNQIGDVHIGDVAGKIDFGSGNQFGDIHIGDVGAGAEIHFGTNNQFGDIHIGDVAGGNMYKVTVNNQGISIKAMINRGTNRTSLNFGTGNQIGNVRIGSVAGRNIYKVSIPH